MSDKEIGYELILSELYAKGILEQAELPRRWSYLVISDLGIVKNKDMNLKREEIDQVIQAVKDLPGE